MLNRMSPFYLTTLSFLGFSKDEQRHMEEVTVENGKLFSAVIFVAVFRFREKWGTLLSWNYVGCYLFSALILTYIVRRLRLADRLVCVYFSILNDNSKCLFRRISQFCQYFIGAIFFLKYEYFYIFWKRFIKISTWYWYLKIYNGLFLVTPLLKANGANYLLSRESVEGYSWVVVRG